MDTPDLLANDTEAPLWSVPLMYDKLEDGGAIYLCTRFDVAHQWQQALTDAGAILKTPIVWDKGNWRSATTRRAGMRGSWRTSRGCRSRYLQRADKGSGTGRRCC